MSNTKGQPQKPVQQIKIWPVEAAIWKNESFLNVTFSKSYRGNDDKQYKSTSSFGRDDLLLLAKVADAAHSWIVKEERKAYEKQHQA